MSKSLNKQKGVGALSASEISGNKEHFEQAFLLVHQMQWQKEMLAKYGNTMTLLDATYTTTVYDLALFFVI